MIIEIDETSPSSLDSGRCQAEAMARIRDRVLLYTRGLDVDPCFSLELALETLRRSAARGGSCSLPEQEEKGLRGPGICPDMAQAMETLYGLLHEKELCLGGTDNRGAPLRSAPPMNRRSMIAEEMDRFPLRRLLHKLGRLVRPRSTGTLSVRP